MTAKKEVETIVKDEMLPGYDFTGGVRGKYPQRFAEGSNIVVLSPDKAKAFPTSEVVNKDHENGRE